MKDERNSNRDLKMAVLIDGDNAQASLLPKMLAEVGRHGSITLRRIYGDWTTSSMNSWKEALHTQAIQPVQQFRYTVGKNATDSALIIDAMDILHRKLVDGFAIVSSDSDYTRLATRIREEGMFVMGIGQKKTPKAFVNACDIFIYTENIAPPRTQSRSQSQQSSRSQQRPQSQQPKRSRGGRRGKGGEREHPAERSEAPVLPQPDVADELAGVADELAGVADEPLPPALPQPDVADELAGVADELIVAAEEPQPMREASYSAAYAGGDPLPLLREAFEMAVEENNWASLGNIGKALLQLDPGFDPRTYGQKQLSRLLESYSQVFELKRLDENAPSNVYVRLREP
jgi:hypothetical protein